DLPELRAWLAEVTRRAAERERRGTRSLTGGCRRALLGDDPRPCRRGPWRHGQAVHGDTGAGRDHDPFGPHRGIVMVCYLLTVLAALGDGPATQPPGVADELTRPLVVWSGRYPAGGATKAPGTFTTELIGTEEEWARFWKARRGDEQVPR